ncbi:hypothetical protein EMPG_11801, partial [Blastomyces silverae]
MVTQTATEAKEPLYNSGPEALEGYGVHTLQTWGLGGVADHRPANRLIFVVSYLVLKICQCVQ